MIMAPHLSHLAEHLRWHSHLIPTPHVTIFVPSTIVHLTSVSATFHHPVLEYSSQFFTGLDITVIAGYLESHHIFVQIHLDPIVSNSIARIVTTVIIISSISVTIFSEGSRTEDDRCEKQQSHSQGNLGRAVSGCLFVTFVHEIIVHRVPFQ
jgi:hypothetical protein